jgi:hypothetical protein
MAIDEMQAGEIIEEMERFLSRIRPPEAIRSQLDIGYRIEDQSILVLEIRPRWDKPEIRLEMPIAKTTFVKARNHWKVYWMRGNLKWESYPPQPTVKHLAEFTKLVEEDDHYCFWG